MRNLRDMTYDDLATEARRLEEKPYRAEQLFAWIYQRRAVDIDEMTDVSKAFRARLKEEFFIGGGNVLEVRKAADGTRKFLSELEDGARIESVIIPETDRLTLCVSSQAGCALGCRFCMTGMAGFTRNLTLSELTNQVFSATSILEEGEKLTNIVLMGMGEPLNNYDNVLKFTKILTAPRGFGFSHNKVTLSTAGLVPGIRKLGEESNVNLAVSLNATTDEVRDRIMPINKKYPLAELVSALRYYPLKGKRHITIEYVVLKDVNDSIEDAKRLVRLLHGLPCKINLIPFNAFPGAAFKSPETERVLRMHDFLKEAGFVVIVRSSKGSEIQAACGQLKGWYEAKGA